MITQDRYGDWIETYSGIKMYPLDPRAAEILPQDIAHALSQICRYTGHTQWFYSVGQHSLLCMELSRRRGYPLSVQLRVLLHDASEAYICDVARPVKPWLRGYMDMERRLSDAIYERFGLPVDDSQADELVKQVDNHMLYLEAKKLLRVADWALDIQDEQMAALIIHTPMQQIERCYLQALEQLRIDMGRGV